MCARRKPKQQALFDNSKKIEPDSWEYAKSCMTCNVLMTPQFETAWNEWAWHKRQKRSKLTQIATKRAIRKCEEMGHDRAIGAIEFSISGNYQGIFEPRFSGTQDSPARVRDPKRKWDDKMQRGEGEPPF